MKVLSGDVILINDDGLNAMMSALHIASQQALNNCKRVLKTATVEMHRRIVRISPVDTGRMRAGWVLTFEEDDKSITGYIGTSIKSASGIGYPALLEFGTDRIASGRVKDWKPGDEPILEWPAKSEGLPNFYLEKDRVYSKQIGGKERRFIHERGAGAEGSKKFERSVAIATKAMTRGVGEQMPMIRPIAYEMRPNIIDAIIRTAHEGLAAGLDGKRF